MRWINASLDVVAMCLGTTSVAHGQEYDLVITSGRIIGKETIDATGLVVAPGFIDTHFHAPDPLGTKLGVADGITTGMDVEAGSMPVAEWPPIIGRPGTRRPLQSSTFSARHQPERYVPRSGVECVEEGVSRGGPLSGSLAARP